MRRILQRRLGDPNEVEFTDSELNEILNLAAADVQGHVMAFDPTAFMTVTRQNVVSGTDLYRKPDGWWAIAEVRLLNSTSGKYLSLRNPVDPYALDLIDSAADAGSTRYAHFGQYIKLGPIPSTSVTNGLEWWWVPSAEIADDAAEDGQAYSIHIALHNAIMQKAFLILAPELDEQTNLQFLEKQYERDIERIPQYYRRQAGQEVPFRPDVDKGY